MIVATHLTRRFGARVAVDDVSFEVRRSEIVALTVAQSASMEYYEKLVDQMFTRTGALVERLVLQQLIVVMRRFFHGQKLVRDIELRQRIVNEHSARK